MTSPFVKIPKKIFGVPVVVGGNPDFGVANDFARMPPHRPGGQIFIETCMCNALFKFNSFKCCKIVFSVAETTSGFGRRPTTQFCDTNTYSSGRSCPCVFFEEGNKREKDTMESPVSPHGLDSTAFVWSLLFDSSEFPFSQTNGKRKYMLSLDSKRRSCT